MKHDPADLFDRHRELLVSACAAYVSREAFTPFTESPSRRHHREGAHKEGRAAYEARLGRAFELEGAPPTVGHVDGERSPYTGARLGVRYARHDPNALFDAVEAAWGPWRVASIEARIGVCLEMLERLHGQTFENAYATMHTAGQAFMLAFAGSGASSLDRGLEAVAAAWLAMDAMPRCADYVRSFGGAPVRLRKRYRLMPVGAAVVLSCGSYPAWNAYPAILANLATGNPVILKPHPDTILPMAIAVETMRSVLEGAGFDPNLLTLAVDTWEAPIATRLLSHPSCAIVDFTGGQRFGAHIETSYPRLQVYTETAGCNAVVLESARDLDATLGAIAYGLVLFSAQMCTAPQNIWIPAAGVRDGERVVTPGEVGARLSAAVDALLEDPRHAAGLCGALHADSSLKVLDALRDASPPESIVRASAPYAHPEHPQARTATPLILALDAADRALAQQERFGPVSFLITAPNRDAALSGACHDAKHFGAIASYAYTTDEVFIEAVEDAFALAGASVGINLHGHRPMNFTAAFSDYHVTGLNPAGNACLTDAAFVDRRFRVVQSKVEFNG